MEDGRVESSLPFQHENTQPGVGLELSLISGGERQGCVVCALNEVQRNLQQSDIMQQRRGGQFMEFQWIEPAALSHH